MTSFRLILESLIHHWRLNLAVALGVMAGTAVLTGALLVGDSMRGSLRDLTLDRLGAIDDVLVAPGFFRTELAEQLSAQPQFQEHFERAIPAIILRAGLRSTDDAAFAGDVTVLGVDEAFWEAGREDIAIRPDPLPQTDELVLNEPLAKELGVAVGDEVLLELQQVANKVAGDSIFGKKDETVKQRPLKVTAIIPADGLGRFGLHPNQQLPLNAYTTIGTLQRALLDRENRSRVNALLVTGKHSIGKNPTTQAQGVLQNLLKPELTDYGVNLEKTERGYFNLTSDRMLLSDALQKDALQAFDDEGAQPALTFLANYIRAGDSSDEETEAKIPYSIVTAIDLSRSSPGELGPWKLTDGTTIQSLEKNELLLNSWAFENLNEQLSADGEAGEEEKLKPGDEVRLTFFDPTATGGQAVERTVAFTLRGVVPLDEQSPANDQAFTPTVPGVTDQDSIENWDPPFEFFQSRVRQIDEDYWDEYRATPKAFVSLEQGQELWGSRFGNLTSIRIPGGEETTVESLAGQFTIKPEEMGFRFQPVKAQGLMAAAGTTPFGVLFISFSFFIIASAVMLVYLLFRLGAESRAEEVGILLASGFSRSRVRRLLMGEGLFVAAVGGLLGTAVGAAYAALMVHGLRTWWVAAVSTPFLQLHTTLLSFIIGYASGVLISMAAIGWALRQMRKVSLRRLIAGQAQAETSALPAKPTKSRILGLAMLATAGLLAAAASMLGGGAQAGAFFGSGICVLVGSLALLWGQLRIGGTGQVALAKSLPVARLAARNGARNPGRSSLTIALVASATFLIVAISAFYIDPTQQQPTLESGNGGFALVAESSRSVNRNVYAHEELLEEGTFQTEDELALSGTTVYPCRVLSGEDASCNNLYQTQRPQVLGVTPEIVQRGGFAWSRTLALLPEEQKNPWLLLSRDVGKTEDGRDYVPVVIDENTAMYSLHLYQPGDTLELEDDYGRQVPLKLVGMLKNSIFQGDVLMSEAQFLEQFPQISGYRFFLVQAPQDADEEKIAAISKTLERGILGLDTQDTGARLAGFLAVQNTYLSTFQSLGALGLLLGTFGLATVQLRNVLERRGELALLRATGFRRLVLAQLVMTENALLLIAGLAVGGLSALVAVAPHLGGGGATIPWRDLLLTLTIVLAVGLIVGLLAVRATLKAPLIQALRGE